MSLSPENARLLAECSPAFADLPEGARLEFGLAELDLLLNFAREEGREEARDAAAEDAAGESI